MPVRDLMSTTVVSAPVGTPVQDAYALMREGGFRHLPVLGTNGKLMGILSERDLRKGTRLRRQADHGRYTGAVGT